MLLLIGHQFLIEALVAVGKDIVFSKAILVRDVLDAFLFAVHSAFFNAIDTIDDNLANGTVRRTRISEWTLPNGETGRSIQKIIDHQPATNPYPVDELVDKLAEWQPPKPEQDTHTDYRTAAFVIGAGDFQIGKGIPGGETSHFADDYLHSLIVAKHYWQQAGSESG